MSYTVTEVEREQKVKRIELESTTHRIYECPVCGGGKVHIENSVFYGMCDRCGATMYDFEPLPHQMEYFLSDATYKLLIGGYGCMAPESKVLMFDGTIKEHQDVVVGDKLMGPDSTARTVLEVHSGRQPRYAVKFKDSEVPLYFNDQHEFYLRNRTYKYKGDGKKNYRNHFRDDEDIFIKVEDYMNTTDRFKKDNLWIFPKTIEFDSQDVPISPYLLGAMLGDGSFRTSRPYFSNMDDVILAEFREYVVSEWVDKRNGLKTISLNEDFEAHSKELGLWKTSSGDKFIPEVYKNNSEVNRLQLLAGLIDTDGSANNGYEITSKSKQLADDIAQVARTLGMRATVKLKKIKNYPDTDYYRVHLSGNNVDKIPVRLERKKLNLNPNKRHDIRSFTVEHVGDNLPYVGFTVDVDNLYIEGEYFSVVKNSGKTTISCFDDAYHALTIPNSRILVTAPTLQQMRVAVLPELNKFIPPWFLEGGRAKGNPPVYKFLNGSEIHVYASDDEQKIRSINLTRFHIEEGSGVPKPVFDQLQARLRNNAASVYNEHGVEIGNKFSGVISTNPEDAWIKDDFLLKSSRLHGSASIDLSVYEPLMHHERVELFETFISASYDNVMLPKGTIDRISAGKDERWKRKYLLSMLDAREGLVYPDMHKHFVEPFEIPKTWRRIGGYDPGISDPTATLIGAINPETNVIYFYYEYYVRDQAISYHGQKLVPHITPYNWYRPMSSDPSVNKRSQESGQTYRAYFKQATGITLNPVNNDILYGIDKVRDYLHLGRIKIFNNLMNFKRESSIYGFNTPENKDYRNANNRPIDRDNHLMDCLRYAIVPLPEDPNRFTTAYVQDDIWKNTGVFIGARDEEKGRRSGGITYGFKAN